MGLGYTLGEETGSPANRRFFFFPRGVGVERCARGNRRRIFFRFLLTKWPN
mgnify:CR=1 FL=1